ncbi:kelch-like protein 34 [Protopterus annectens]|uniref:kelch-like protein 34 n=1 Tax=Protopterus annectens TaxID=7888 RepID=UPI001CFB1C68|nr:kelch-like protein 34 [Protopterus annectens]
MNYFLAHSKPHTEAILTQFQWLRAEGFLCDVILEVDGTIFPAHRALLACSSDYFKAMFKDYTKESKAKVIRLQEVTARGLQLVLDFIYTSWLSLSMETIEETLLAATYLQVIEAIRLCGKYLISHLNLGNCCFSANVAYMFYLADTLASIEKFILHHLWRLLEFDLDTIGLLELNADSMLFVVISEDIPNVKELSLLTLILEWLDYDKTRCQYSSRLLSRVRYGLIPLADLTALFYEYEVLQTPPVKSLVWSAMDYHNAAHMQPVMQSLQTTPRNLKEEIILVGGETDNNEFVTDIFAYNTNKKKWRSATQVKEKVRNHCVCVIGNFLYVLGGEIAVSEENNRENTVTVVTDAVYRYDPRFNKWMEPARMLERRTQFSCCVLQDRIFAAGGQDENEQLHSSVEAYDINADEWRKITDLPHKMHGHASVVCNNVMYLSGGKYAGQLNHTSKDMYSYNALGGHWIKRAPMTIARFGHQMAAVDQTIFAFLGMYEPFCDIEKYDPIQNQWIRLKPLRYDRFCYGMAVLGETIYLIGGKKWQDSQQVPTQNIIAYDISGDTWEEISSLPIPLYGVQCDRLQFSELTDL